MTFPTSFHDILNCVEAINPEQYGQTRNFKNGAVTYLSPYISRGVISTQTVFHHIQKLDLPKSATEKLVQELAWRDYWQQIWISKGNAINHDLKRPQPQVRHHDIPVALLNHSTEISAIDTDLKALEQSGYMHNHMRMYVAAMACNFAGAHWYNPAKWMYYHLLDGDWASNALSWQWVAGSNASKKYVMNQANINKYWPSNQTETYLDCPYEVLPLETVPKPLRETKPLQLSSQLPQTTLPEIVAEKPTCVYTYYNLDPEWKKDIDANRILLLDTDHFSEFPISKKCIDFCLALGKNIPHLQVFCGTFKELEPGLNPKNTFFKEHPLNVDFKGIVEPRDWMFSVTGYFPSFFAFWKKCRKTW